MKLIRRLFWLGVLSSVGFVGWNAWQRKNEAAAPGVPEWPPIVPPSATPAATPPGAPAPTSFVELPNDDGAKSASTADERTTATDAHSTSERWVEPVNGSCPTSHPVKANDNSGIYHVPSGRFYDRTGAERCYAEASDAEADGYRAAKS
jgi:hypothetical protein